MIADDEPPGVSNGIAFKTQAEAEAVLRNAYSIEDKGYPVIREIVAGMWGVQAVYLSEVGTALPSVTVKEYGQDDSDFIALRDECMEVASGLYQRAYDQKVAIAKRSEYLRLANGDESIAKAFWSKIESQDWPEVAA